MNVTEYLSILFVLVVLVSGIIMIMKVLKAKEGFADYKTDGAYKDQLAKVVALRDLRANGRQNMGQMLDFYESASTKQDPHEVLPPDQDSLVNFYTLGCRFAGYLGPFEKGYFNTREAVMSALKMGCRSFVLEIDYNDECKHKSDDNARYFPQLVVRNVQGRKFHVTASNPDCQTSSNSSINDVSKALSENAFSLLGSQNGPLIIILYILRVPQPDSQNPNRKLNYLSNIAKALNPLLNRNIENIPSGGKFSRQQQESLLLTNSIRDYNERVIFMCNANTDDFRTASPKYDTDKDLDYIVNLRLTMGQTQLGATTQTTTSQFGKLDTVQSYLSIPQDQITNAIEKSKLTYSVCFEQDPQVQTDSDTFQNLTSKFGINCIPIQIWNSDSDFLFNRENGMFAKYSFIPKPKNLRFIKEPLLIPKSASVTMNAQGGELRVPTTT
uniref:PI-PLC Y-box domain-containing protein n=1 Tax=viral metagenome TaxID=1070528 RepID=A0A6C0DHV0_9ZZZZ